MTMSLSLGGHLRARHRFDIALAQLAHLLGELPAALLVGAVDLDVANVAHLANGQELRARLLAGAEQADLLSVVAGHVLGGDAAGRPGAHLAQVIRLHQRQQVAGLAVEKADVKLAALARGAVGLVAHDAERFRRADSTCSMA